MRIVQLGHGAVGKENIRQLVNRGHQVVGIVDKREVLDQIDLTSIGFRGKAPMLDVDLKQCIANSEADLVLQSTAFDPDDMLDVVTHAAAAKCDLITINPMVDIRQMFPELCRSLDQIAKEGGIRVLGVGAIPGFFSDVLPLTFSGACADVSVVKFRRCADFSKWGPAVLKKFGFGLSPEIFSERIKAGEIALFGSLWQSAKFIAHELRWPIIETEEFKRPLISDRERNAEHMRVAAGSVGGFSHRVVIYSTSLRSIDIEVIGFVDPAGDQEQPGMSVEIIGDPQMRIDIGGDVLQSSGALVSSSARMVNSIGPLLTAPPGLRTTADLPLIACRRPSGVQAFT